MAYITDRTYLYRGSSIVNSTIPPTPAQQQFSLPLDNHPYPTLAQRVPLHATAKVPLSPVEKGVCSVQKWRISQVILANHKSRLQHDIYHGQGISKSRLSFYTPVYKPNTILSRNTLLNYQQTTLRSNSKSHSHVGLHITLLSMIKYLQCRRVYDAILSASVGQCQ